MKTREDVVERLSAWVDAEAMGKLDGCRMGRNRVERKVRHTKRVIGIALELLRMDSGIGHVGWEAPLASAILHDIGRFEQVARFDDFNDAATVDHGELGAQLIAGRSKWLDFMLGEGNSRRVEEAVRYHNKLALAGPLAGDMATSASWQLVQDADRIDIFGIVLACVEGESDPSYSLGNKPVGSVPFDRRIFELVASGGDVPTPERYFFPHSLLSIVSWGGKMHLPASKRMVLEARFPTRLAAGFAKWGVPDARAAVRFAESIEEGLRP